MIKDIIKVVKQSNHVLLAAHENPDGDAIGSLAGMANICDYFNVAYTLMVERIPDEYVFLMGNRPIHSTWDKAYDTFISLDCGDVYRLGFAKKYFEKAQTTINIDHHETNNHFATYNYVEKDASSTSELIFNMIEEANIPLTENIAKAIYSGIVTDTGGFMHSCTKPSTHLAVSKILGIPFDFSEVYYQLIHQKTEKTVLLQGIAMHHLTKLSDGKIFLSYISHEDLESQHATREDASSIVTHIKNIKGCEIAALVYPNKEPSSYKVSLRCNAPYNVAEIASVFGGGGHIRAAGATIKGELQEVIETLKSTLSAL
ncbi:MAG: uncharacterized protein K0S71_431 [Clostridia bacterium]|jgi:phosphoesterase RecJ-like protein|nr:uncharacterized protein [Clostridia bacterium]